MPVNIAMSFDDVLRNNDICMVGNLNYDQLKEMRLKFHRLLAKEAGEIFLEVLTSSCMGSELTPFQMPLDVYKVYAEKLYKLAIAIKIAQQLAPSIGINHSQQDLCIAIQYYQSQLGTIFMVGRFVKSPTDLEISTVTEYINTFRSNGIPEESRMPAEYRMMINKAIRAKNEQPPPRG